MTILSTPQTSTMLPRREIYNDVPVDTESESDNADTDTEA